MPDYLITYDLHVSSEDIRKAFIAKALDQLFTYVWQSNPSKTLLRLPASTLWTETRGPAIAELRFKEVVRNIGGRYPLSIEIEKLFICEIGAPIVESDKNKQPETAWEHARPLPTCMAHQHHDPYFAY